MGVNRLAASIEQSGPIWGAASSKKWGRNGQLQNFVAKNQLVVGYHHQRRKQVLYQYLQTFSRSTMLPSYTMIIFVYIFVDSITSFAIACYRQFGKFFLVAGMPSALLACHNHCNFGENTYEGPITTGWTES